MALGIGIGLGCAPRARMRIEVAQESRVDVLRPAVEDDARFRAIRAGGGGGGAPPPPPPRLPGSMVSAYDERLHTIQPARLRRSAVALSAIDAIDTDQITPAADCVSESLDTLDERWKAGSFRYLMPDFRARVHRGETFVIAGDRFAIGSSREMSPAGPEGRRRGGRPADGRRLRRQHGRHLPAQRLQPRPARRAESRGGRRRAGRRRVHLRSRDAAAANETQGKTYEPVPLSPKEEEIRRSGGIFAVGRASSARPSRRAPRSTGPTSATARGMTTTEQIVWAHRVDKDSRSS